MTLEEAIIHCEEKADCSECGKEHKQLAEWLKELKLWRTERISEIVKNPFASTSTMICVNCDHKDEYIQELEAEKEWIPCSERMPEECEEVLVWYEYFRYGDYNCMFQTYGIGYHVEGHWRGNVNGVKARCIAWMPLPEPYHE